MTALPSANVCFASLHDFFALLLILFLNLRHFWAKVKLLLCHQQHRKKSLLRRAQGHLASKVSACGGVRQSESELREPRREWELALGWERVRWRMREIESSGLKGTPWSRLCTFAPLIFSRALKEEPSKALSSTSTWTHEKHTHTRSNNLLSSQLWQLGVLLHTRLQAQSHTHTHTFASTVSNTHTRHGTFNNSAESSSWTCIISECVVKARAGKRLSSKSWKCFFLPNLVFELIVICVLKLQVSRIVSPGKC